MRARAPNIPFLLALLALAESGARLVSGSDVKVLQSGSGGAVCRLFVDGFESGGTLAWSARVP